MTATTIRHLSAQQCAALRACFDAALAAGAAPQFVGQLAVDLYVHLTWARIDARTRAIAAASVESVLEVDDEADVLEALEYALRAEGEPAVMP